MNDSHDSPSEPHDDASLEEFLAPLKGLAPSLEARLRNRAAVADEVNRVPGANRQRHSPWWSRSISVPLPLAAALAALVVFAVLSSRFGIQPSGIAASPNRQAMQTPNLSKEKAIDTHTPTALPRVEYYETATYLCGIGRLKTDRGYLIQEENQ